ncbi:MAG: hypothetical protein JW708_03550 [Vallitaleaceae bacterium]|nr:hypothetical protein [Vallitaleaceae bacterium]
MIDLHYHLLYGVDDGAEDLQQALDMIAISYKQGVRTIIVTPHLNHPLNFSHQNHEEIFGVLVNEIKASYPDMKLFLAGEIYVSREMINQPEKLMLRTIPSSNYILIEFDPYIHYREMDSALHEIKLLGLRPILAHVENYSCLRHKDCNRIIELKNEGVLVQTNSSSLFGKIKSKKKRFVRTLLKTNLIDFVASDAHNTTTRKPDLQKAYRYVSRHYGACYANQIFSKNQELILKNEFIDWERKEAKTIFSRKTTYFLGLFLSISFLLFSSTKLSQKIPLEVFSNETEAIRQDQSEKKVPMDIIQPEKIYDELTLQEELPSAAQEELPTEVQEEFSSEIEAIDAQEEAIQTTTETTIEPTEAVQVGYEEIVTNYKTELLTLQSGMISLVSGFAASLKTALTIEDENERTAALISIRDTIYAAEAEADNEVNAILYQMQTELEAKSYDTVVISELRNEYLAIKETQSELYMSELSEYYSSLEGN